MNEQDKTLEEKLSEVKLEFSVIRKQTLQQLMLGNKVKLGKRES